MARVLKREAAKRDLISQWLWYAENAGVEVADRFYTSAEKTLRLLATQPVRVVHGNRDLERLLAEGFFG